MDQLGWPNGQMAQWVCCISKGAAIKTANVIFLERERYIILHKAAYGNQSNYLRERGDIPAPSFL